jgi:two-component system, chemotaxis family, protein-glutamate methylesterase/glutaminase
MAKDQITKPELLLIGGSSGSLGIVLSILTALPENYPVAIMLVMHRNNSRESLLNEVLGIKSNMPVIEVEEKEPIRASTVYLAPADYHVLIEKDRTFSLDYSEKQNYSRPSIDVSFTSAAEVYGPHLMGILLSGANDDGTAGMLSIKNMGGYCIIQDPADAMVDYMPRHALERMQADAVLSGPEIVRYLLSIPESLFA